MLQEFSYHHPGDHKASCLSDLHGRQYSLARPHPAAPWAPCGIPPGQQLEDSFIVNGSSHYDAYMEQLVAAKGQVKLARKHSLREPASIQYGASLQQHTKLHKA